MTTTETIASTYSDLDLWTTEAIAESLLASQRQACEAVQAVQSSISTAVNGAAEVLMRGHGRLAMAGAGASGRLAVQDGAEMWPTFGWPAERLLLSMAGGTDALLHSIEGVEDDASDARQQVEQAQIGADDVVVCIAASGRSPWTCEWASCASARQALTIGFSGNADTPLLNAVQHGIHLDSGPEVLAGSTRMAAGTAQKIALNVFSTSLMIRLNRTYGNLMVDMAAKNTKLDQRRITMLKSILPALSDDDAVHALEVADGHVKVAALVAVGQSLDQAHKALAQTQGSLREALGVINPS